MGSILTILDQGQGLQNLELDAAKGQVLSSSAVSWHAAGVHERGSACYEEVHRALRRECAVI